MAAVEAKPHGCRCRLQVGIQLASLKSLGTFEEMRALIVAPDGDSSKLNIDMLKILQQVRAGQTALSPHPITLCSVRIAFHVVLHGSTCSQRTAHCKSVQAGKLVCGGLGRGTV